MFEVIVTNQLMYLTDNVLVGFTTKSYSLQVAGQTCNLQAATLINFT